MKILQVHNFYQHSGGEDQVYQSEAELLRFKGHNVIQYTLHNDEIESLSKGQLIQKTIWNSTSYQDIERLIIQNEPDVCHFHNTFPLISPSTYYACQRNHVPVIQTLHNYRLICPNALLLRSERICEDCVDKPVPVPGVLHACYRHSKSASAVVATMLSFHRLLGTWSRQVDIYIALTDFARQKFIAGGLPATKIVVKPNFIASDPSPRSNSLYALYVGRLSTEKGITTLLEAGKYVGDIPLKIVGDGPLMQVAKEYVEDHSLRQIELLGSQSSDQVFSLLQQASFLVFPSICYEACPMTIIEAFACGVPVISSQLGAPAEIVKNHQTGLLFQAGNAYDLAEKITWAWDNKTIMEEMGRNARLEYESKYTAEKNLHSLEEIYELAVKNY